MSKASVAEDSEPINIYIMDDHGYQGSINIYNSSKPKRNLNKQVSNTEAANSMRIEEFNVEKQQ